MTNRKTPKKSNGQKKNEAKKKTQSFDTPFSSDDTVIVAIILVAILAIALFGLYSAQKNPEQPPTPSVTTTTGDGVECPTVYEEYVEKAAADYGIEKERIYAVMRVESGFKPEAVSRSGARGLTQMLPSTYEELCKKRGVKYNPNDLFKPEISIDFGMYYLKWLYDYFGDWDLAHMAYNAGIGTVNNWLKDPRYTENGKIVYIPKTQTREYVKRINEYYEQYKY